MTTDNATCPAPDFTITISQGLTWKKTLENRLSELQQLRNQNSATVTRSYGVNADKPVETKPVYDAIALDKVITGLSKELRILDEKIKETNATLKIVNYTRNEDVLGELVEAKK